MSQLVVRYHLVNQLLTPEERPVLNLSGKPREMQSTHEAVRRGQQVPCPTTTIYFL